MVHLLLNAIIIFSFLAIISERDISFSYLTRIEARSVVFPAFRLIPARIVDRFSAVYSASARSFI
jgi:hypothetical protein